MRYKLDNAGYVCAVSFGCYLDNCTEYTGAVPTGYNNLDEWASYACIQAYYLDTNGNLVLDYERQLDLEKRQAQEAIDNSPVYKKDLYNTDESLDKQYKKATAKGKVITLNDINTLEPKVKITGINPYEKDLITIYTQSKNLMPCNATSQEISGMKFTVNEDHSISVIGTALADIEYSILSEETFTAFCIKKELEYHLNLGGFDCELRLAEGETRLQQYVGASGLLNLYNSIEVNEVVLKIPFGTTVETTFFPQLEYGRKFTEYAEHKRKRFVFDLGNHLEEATLPSDTLFPSDTQYARETLFPDEMLYPSDKLIPKEKVLIPPPVPRGSTVEYILIENGTITASIDGKEKIIGSGYVGLYRDYDTIYVLQDSDLEIEYSTNVLDIKDLEFMQGKETTTGKFRVLEDGSIEAKDGYFSGEIYAESGYFNGDIIGGSININGRFVVDKDGNLNFHNPVALINNSGEEITILANKIDLVGVVNSEIFMSNLIESEMLIANYASVDALEVANARVDILEVDHVSISDFEALSQTVAGKLSTNQLSATIASLNGISVNSISCSSYIMNYGNKGMTLNPIQVNIGGTQYIVLGVPYGG